VMLLPPGAIMPLVGHPLAGFRETQTLLRGLLLECLLLSRYLLLLLLLPLCFLAADLGLLKAFLSWLGTCRPYPLVRCFHLAISSRLVEPGVCFDA